MVASAPRGWRGSPRLDVFGGNTHLSVAKLEPEVIEFVVEGAGPQMRSSFRLAMAFGSDSHGPAGPFPGVFNQVKARNLDKFDPCVGKSHTWTT